MQKRQLSVRLVLCVVVLFVAMVATGPAYAYNPAEIDAKVNGTLKTFYKNISGGKELAKKSHGMLVFPQILKGGFIIGGEWGDGALRINNKTADYYRTIGGSIGFQIGGQARSVILMFMTQKALSDFRRSDGWEAGVDGSVAIANVGAGGTIDTTTVQDPIIAFIFGQKGLMLNLTLEGSKFTRLK